MICDRRRLSFYRDGQLSVAERYEVDCHLAQCAECTTELRGLMRLAQTIRSMPLEPVSPHLGHDVRRLITERGIQPRQPLTASRLGWAVAPVSVAASIAISLMVTFRPGGIDLSNPMALFASHGVEVTASRPAASVDAGATVVLPAKNSATTAPVTVAANPPAGSASQTAGPSVTGGTTMATRPTGNAVASLAPTAGDSAQVPVPIARFYAANRQVRDMLGDASPGSRTVTLLEQSFQGGLAIWRSDTREIYVLRRDGNTWTRHADTWSPDEKIGADLSPPPGAMVPAGGFGTVWRSTPEIQKRLGWAVYEPRGSGGLIQTFEHGLVVWTPHGLLYVLTSDGRWHTYPDATPI